MNPAPGGFGCLSDHSGGAVEDHQWRAHVRVSAFCAGQKTGTKGIAYGITALSPNPRWCGLPFQIGPTSAPSTALTPRLRPFFARASPRRGPGGAVPRKEDPPGPFFRGDCGPDLSIHVARGGELSTALVNRGAQQAADARPWVHAPEAAADPSCPRNRLLHSTGPSRRAVGRPPARQGPGDALPRHTTPADAIRSAGR